MFLLSLLLTFIHMASGNDLELLLHDIDFRHYRIMAKASEASFLKSMSFFNGDFTYVEYDNDVQSILGVLYDYNKTAHYAYQGLDAFVTFCPDLIQTGVVCSSSLSEMLSFYDIALDIESTLEGETKEDATLKIQELYEDIYDVELTCYERNASSFILSSMVTEAWYFVDGLEDEVNQMQVQIKQHEDRMHRETGLHNYTASVSSQKMIKGIRNASRSANGLRYAVEFCQRHILNYSLINSTSYL